MWCVAVDGMLISQTRGLMKKGRKGKEVVELLRVSDCAMKSLTVWITNVSLICATPAVSSSSFMLFS